MNFRILIENQAANCPRDPPATAGGTDFVPNLRCDSVAREEDETSFRDHLRRQRFVITAK